MFSFQTRLFFRTIAKSKEAYFLKIISLATAFACSTLILLFSINEFGYDRFHQEHNLIFRVLQRNNNESFIGNRFSNKIPLDVFNALKRNNAEELVPARVQLLDKVNVLANHQSFNDSKLYAADPELCSIFSFEIVSGSLKEFREKEGSVILSSMASKKYFGTDQSEGKKWKIYTLGDTLVFTVAAVYKDYPQNSHEEFNSFIRFDSTTLQALSFDPKNTGVYLKLLEGSTANEESMVKKLPLSNELTYRIQPIAEIYFGPRVAGEDSKHGDQYSIIILICVTALILFLSLTSFVNLTTLTLPYRSKELAIKKLAGTGQASLTFNFAKESILVVGMSMILGIMILIVISGWIESILAINMIALFVQGNLQLVLILMTLFLVVAITPLFMTPRFTRATPNRLLSAETITFPRFKRTIMFLQLGISIFLIVAAMVIKRQINYSLLKEPGRNYDQIVYVSYPKDLTNAGLASMRLAWKKGNANVVDLMAASQLPDRVSSKELNSEFYFISVDRGFKDFFELEMLQGNWFRANDGDSMVVVNERGRAIHSNNTRHVIGVFKDLSGQYNQPEKPLKISVSSHVNYHYLCIRILEVDIRRTVQFLENYFGQNGQKATVSFLDKRFEEWLTYQDKLNALSQLLAIISGLLSCFAIYGLSISIVRDKLKQIAIHKLCGASIFSLTRLLVKEFASQMLLAILIFGPLTYIIIKEMLRNFVFTTNFSWLDPIVPLAYCLVVITLLCGFQTLSLNRADLTSALKR
ncbi:MAG: ABC transporter permease [Bacteroidetes bacterium]|nr:ABC transporter permease [Bacteroidota bacterium]